MRLALLALVAATTLTLAASAGAAKPKPVHFAVSIRATSQLNWTLTNDTQYQACGVENGSGTESSTYWTPAPFAIGPIELTGRLHDPFEAMRGQTTRTGTATCSTGTQPELSGCGTWSYDMAGNGADFYLKILNGNDLNFEVHLNTKPFAFPCSPLFSAVYPPELDADSTITLAQLESRPLTVLSGTLTEPIDEPGLGYHATLTNAWELRFKRTA